MGKNDTVRTIRREVVVDPSETTRRAPFPKDEIQAYLQGALHDASLNKRNRFRFSQKGDEWLNVLQSLISSLGYNSWIYKEGKDRDVYVLETLASFLDFAFDPCALSTSIAKSAYIRGFFDAEGGIPKNKTARFYVQLTQCDRNKIQALKQLLFDLDIKTGCIHNPSKRVNPYYWRIYVLSKDHKDFIRYVGSWHPRKQKIFQERMKI
ncbi:MAG: LAGLIDADG family homing endonuclease [Perlabentimonas sp.]